MKILVIGGTGTFGKRLVSSLLNYYDHEIVIAGRNQNKLDKATHLFALSTGRQVASVQLDVLQSGLVNILGQIQPELVVNASGPFQLQAGECANNRGCYLVATACIELGCHYIDLADDRNYVCRFAEVFDQQALNKRLTMVSGASTVPALTDAVIRYYQPQFSEIKSIDYGISPGNKTERGLATVASILSYAGQPFTRLINGRQTRVYGWQNLSRYDFGHPIGKRWMSNCDIPDLELIPKLYPQIKSCRFQAGLEVSTLHLGLWLLSWLSRSWFSRSRLSRSRLSQIRLVKNWRKFSKPLTVISQWFDRCGSDCGGMFVELLGSEAASKTKTKAKKALKLQWQLVAEDGSGPMVPTIAAEILIKKLAEGRLASGASACCNLFELSEFLTVAGRFGIYTREQWL